VKVDAAEQLRVLDAGGIAIVHVNLAQHKVLTVTEAGHRDRGREAAHRQAKFTCVGAVDGDAAVNVTLKLVGGDLHSSRSVDAYLSVRSHRQVAFVISSLILYSYHIIVHRKVHHYFQIN